MLSLVQARSQKFTMGEGCIGSLGAEPPAAGGQMGSGGETPSRRRHGGLGAEQHDSTGCINGLCGRWLMITLQFSCLHAGKS